LSIHYIIRQMCIIPDCNVRPRFNTAGEKALFCSQHKSPGMVNVKDKTCAYHDCNVRPSFNTAGEKALFCSQHKSPGMVDVKSKTCDRPGCNVKPAYNTAGQKALFCTTHKSEGMVDVKSKTCDRPGCNVKPAYNTAGETIGLFCTTHKSEGMVDVKHQTCKTNLCSIRVQEKYDGYCLRCFMYLFPDKPVSRNYKTKEFAVVDFIQSKFPNLSWILDKTISDGCSRKKPDLLLDLGYQVLVIEIDENQHKGYVEICENKRLMELSQDIGHRPIVFIRFNPDCYIKNRKNITSCWGTNKKGICVIKKKEEWEQRLLELEEQVTYWINPANSSNKTIEIIQLFYD
jgi:plastocyanin